MQSFKINLWDNIRPQNRCGTCHSVEGGQTPMFARSDDVNLAYAAANSVVTLTSPKDSMMVAKVGGGHNCWLASNSTCATILTTWITNWAGELASSGGRQITLEAPALRDPGSSKNYPDDQGLLYASTVYPITAKFCSNCHSSSSAVKQQPFFAEGGIPGQNPPSDPNAIKIAYEAAKPKMDLDNPANSRFVLRLRNESHNCWTASCAADADAMQAAIQAFSDAIAPTQIDPNLKTSKALTLYEGTVASGGSRYESSMVALYEFKSGTDCGTSITGACATAYDTSGVNGAGIDLHLSGNVQWYGGWGLNFAGGKAQATTAASAKLSNLIKQTGEYSIEAWVAPGNVAQMRFAHRELLRRRDGAQLRPRPDAVQLRLLQPQQQDGRERQAGPVHADGRSGPTGLAAARSRHVRSGRGPQDLCERRAQGDRRIRRRAAR